MSAMEIHGKQDQGNAAEGGNAGEGGPETPPDRPLFDLSNASVKALAKEVNSERIEGCARHVERGGGQHGRA